MGEVLAPVDLCDAGVRWRVALKIAPHVLSHRHRISFPSEECRHSVPPSKPAGFRHRQVPRDAVVQLVAAPVGLLTPGTLELNRRPADSLPYPRHVGIEEPSVPAVPVIGAESDGGPTNDQMILPQACELAAQLLRRDPSPPDSEPLEFPREVPVGGPIQGEHDSTCEVVADAVRQDRGDRVCRTGEGIPTRVLEERIDRLPLIHAAPASPFVHFGLSGSSASIPLRLIRPPF
jgi:hypothetical protein